MFIYLKTQNLAVIIYKLKKFRVMNVITIESEAFQKLKKLLEAIYSKLNEQEKKTSLTDEWMDNQDVCQLLHISLRTLQHYRDTGKIPFSQNGAKIYYKTVDVEELLERNYIRKKA